MADRGRGRDGRGRRGVNRGRSGAGPAGDTTSNTGICFEFQKKGTCTRTNCPFSHGADQTDSSGSASRKTRATETPEQEQSRRDYKHWKKFLGQVYTDRASEAYTMKRVWSGAFNILQDGDRDWIQQLPRDLDESDDGCNGRAHIKAIVTSRPKSAEIEDFIRTSKVFLDVITHSSLLDCLAVDTYVGGIYSFISGANGERGLKYFQQLSDTLIEFRKTGPDTETQAILDQATIRLAVALYELLKRDYRARFNERLEPLVATLGDAAQSIPVETPSTVATVVNKYLGDIQQMIARAKGLLQDEDDSDNEMPTKTQATATSFPRDLVIPSGRYDNDKRDIAEIIIFPTRDEIMSDAKEFLPSTDPDQPHHLKNSVERHIDTYFRLLRHDIFGEMKGALANFMSEAAEGPNKLQYSISNLGDIRIYSYPNAHVNYLAFETRPGLEARISFPQPPPVRRKSVAERCMWWEDSKRLGEGSLLSFIWIQNNVVDHVFLTVSQRDTRPSTEHSLTDHDSMATITTKLATQDSATLQKLLQLSLHKTHGVLLEFPNIIPATFVPILKNLQGMQRLSRLPFRQWVLPDVHGGPTNTKLYHDIPPPLYARKKGFTFSLDPILKDQKASMSLEPTASCEDTMLIQDLTSKTELDAGQCKALVAALNREFTFIQGPPGTGKSYLGLQIMKVLLGVKEQADLGPIVVVCYTNHALDQFLEHLLKTGITKIIRVGGQSRSDALEGHNLRDVAKTESKTRTESYRTATAFRTLERCKEDATKALGRLHSTYRHAEWGSVSRHLSEKYPKIHKQLNHKDEDGFITAGRRLPFDIWKAGGAANQNRPNNASLNVEQVLGQAANDVHSLTRAERRTLVALWTEEVCLETVASFSATINEATKTREDLNDVHDEADRRVLQEADVIGVTTSGLARRISVLQHLQCKVIICEEAGEVMEPHMISAMLPSVEHFIQIGDHEQLRPSINNFRNLSLESKQGSLYQLDRSQFERLTIGEKGRISMPVAQLEVQRRMRPDVSTLIRETIYPRLVDHSSTLKMPDVVGMRNNVYWLDHHWAENAKDSELHHSKSKSNAWEVQLVHALVRHLVRQGIYNSSDIAVLTPYTGQLQKLRGALRNDFEIVLSERDEEALQKDGFDMTDTSPATQPKLDPQKNRRTPLQKKQLSDMLRIATVDNFQGEEAKIIIVSLVRSNEQKKVGFLKTTNRINVLLSRAQHGMYIIGNSESYSVVAMWQKVINMLRATNSIGDTLGLCCPRHPEKVLEVSQPEHFAHFSPEGGCREACTERLTDCGHQCQARCHSKAMHDVFKCEKPCQRRHSPCDHACQKSTCGEDCGQCTIPINNVKLPCGHYKNNVPCHKTLDLGSIFCDTLVSREVPGCKHNVSIKCSQDVNKENFKCPSPCGTLLPCGDVCPGSCGRCNTKNKEGVSSVNHPDCARKCGRKFGTCNHTCNRPCHSGTDCGLCPNPCEVRCKHSRCTLKCYEPCAPCSEPCVWSCEHQGSCNMPCAAPCDRLPCDDRCTKLLPCGHQCPSICGEDCPTEFCQDCGMKQEHSPDLLERIPYSEINLDESPIVVLGCGHFFTIESLDGLVGLKDAYHVDEQTGRFVGLIETAQLTGKIPKCSDCNQPIRQHVTQRYNRPINKAVVDEQSKRFIVSGEQELHNLETKVTTIGDVLEGSLKALIPFDQTDYDDPKVAERMLERAMSEFEEAIKKRYKDTIKAVNDIKAFQRRTAVQHQPAQKLYAAITHSMSRLTTPEAALAKLSLDQSTKSISPRLDERISLGGCVLEFKIHCLVLEDKFSIIRMANGIFPEGALSLRLPGGAPDKQAATFLKACENLIADCETSSLPKHATEAILYYARVAQALASSGASKDTDRNKAMEYRNTAKELLERAEKHCESSFRDRDALLEAVESSKKLLGRDFYEEVSAAELESIKRAMVTGRGGIATHSGHWYNCVNGHPFAVGECGMPMQQARCPECGEAVGGQNHRPAAGVTRAQNME